MKLKFLGASEAFHDSKTNISMVVSARANLLLDCGYNVPQKFWQSYPDKDFLDAVFVSHFHADHVAGLPMLLMRMRQDKRTNPLTLIGPDGFEDSFKKLYRLVYRGFLEVSGFEIDYKEAKEGDAFSVGDLKLSFAAAAHLVNTPYFVPTLAIRIDCAGKSLCYSSDTVYTERITKLSKGCDILVHDAFMPAASEYHARMPAHSSPRDAGRAASKAGVKKLALFNIHRTFEGSAPAMLDEARKEFSGPIFIPEEGQAFDV